METQLEVALQDQGFSLQEHLQRVSAVPCGSAILRCPFVHLKAGGSLRTGVWGVFKDKCELCHIRSDSLQSLGAAALPASHSRGG